jgi:diguanylate cyclase
VDWSKLPDLGVVALLICAFGSVARRGHMRESRVWLIGWVMIALHFGSFMFVPAEGAVGTLATLIGIAALTWAGVLFMWASVSYRNKVSSHWMLAVLLGTNTLYIGLITTAPNVPWALALAAALFGALPLAVTVVSLRQFVHPLRWAIVILYGVLSIFLLVYQHRPEGTGLALNAVLFAVYFGCCIHFCYAYRPLTTGAFITIAGFFAWAAVFVVLPGIGTLLPPLHVENEVWNLPKYVVAVGMILLLLQDQIEHNRYLALHDELTGLPNRRLFQAQLASALERARRARSQTALLLIDLDQFKQVNDTLGHHFGDLLLRHVSDLFVGRVRRSDTVARTGGDEFSVILEEPVTREQAEFVGHSLKHLLKEPIELGGHTVRIGASVGITLFPEDGATAESLCIAADRKMYSEKHASKNRGSEGLSDLSPIPSE